MQAMRHRFDEAHGAAHVSGVFVRRTNVELVQRAAGSFALLAFPAVGAAFLARLVSVSVYVTLAVLAFVVLALSLIPSERLIASRPTRPTRPTTPTNSRRTSS